MISFISTHRVRHSSFKLLLSLGALILAGGAQEQTLSIYSTQAYDPRSPSPYSSNLAMGDHTLNPKTHSSTRNCKVPNSGLTGFCGDEVAYGSYKLAVDVWGRDNTAIGDHALANNVSGEGNTAVGSSAAANITTSGGVDAFGVAACQNGTNFSGPITCIGQASLEIASTSSQNAVAVGSHGRP